ncbi:hypothetical protein [Desulfopila sp. IMCC35008]|uniref:hypothetical protein n=1 Tax=Desulfopila sp. IMCC35008 TaxID=2653858 RepID=UPI0013D46E96|nr:hypothetical protein [Desulfopila sp. IMCC35008]
MEQQDIEEIVECLPKSRTKFYYFRDRYALMLLSYFIGSGMNIHDIRKSKFKKLLEKPAVKELLQKTGRKSITPGDLSSFWPSEYHCYLVTLGAWGGKGGGTRFYKQTSRPGWNLVLQLNFSAQHNASYTNLIKPQHTQPFESSCHPISKKEGEYTLAWARIDLDLEADEALIEEIQTDWIRLALRSRRYVSRHGDPAKMDKRRVPRYIRGLGCDERALNKYIDNELKPHMAIWEEAVLMSSIWFLKEEIGISTIYYHTFDFGCELKRIDGEHRPPRSLYTKLPKRFCFERTSRSPDFLKRKSNRRSTGLITKGEDHFYALTV